MCLMCADLKNVLDYFKIDDTNDLRAQIRKKQRHAFTAWSH